MTCPHCQFENESGARFCARCGAPLPSPRRKFFLAFMKALLYYALFSVVQSTVLYVYLFSSTLSSMLGGGALGGDPALLFEEIMTEVLTLLMENLHPIMILSGLITILILCIAFRIRRKKPLAEIHLVPTSPIAPSTGLFSLLFGVALQAVVVITISFLPLSAELMDSLTESSLLLSGGPILVQFLNAAIVTPFVEELVFRGLVFTRLSRGMRTGAAVVLSAILFGTAHGTVIGFLYATLLGLVFAALMRRHGNSFFTSFLCHMGFNGASFLLTMVPDNQLLILAIYFASIAAALLLAYLLFRKPAEKTDA